MKYFILLSCLFLGPVIFQLIIWRIKRPERQKSFLLKLFFIPIILTGAIVFAQSYSLIPVMLPYSILEFAYVFMVWFPLIFSYLVSYTLIEAEGPTFLILLSMDAVGNKGLRKEQFTRFITDDLFVFHRLKGVLDDGLATFDGEFYRITEKGEGVLKSFMIPRKIIGKQQQGG